MPVRALTRNPDGADLPADVEVVRGDLTISASLDHCLRNVEVVFLVWTSGPDAASETVKEIAKHTHRVVLLSSPHQTPHPFFQQKNPMAALHAEVERLIDASGLRRTTLRPGMFAANVRHWWAPQIRAGDVVRWPYAAARTAPIHERDIAAVAVRALVDSRHDGAEYVLTGPQSLTQAEQVAVIGDALGRTLRFDEMTPDEVRQEWRAPATVVDMLLRAWEAARGQPALVSNTVEEITGSPARTFREWVIDHAELFRT